MGFAVANCQSLLGLYGRAEEPQFTCAGHIPLHILAAFARPILDAQPQQQRPPNRARRRPDRSESLWLRHHTHLNRKAIRGNSRLPGSILQPRSSNSMMVSGAFFASLTAR